MKTKINPVQTVLKVTSLPVNLLTRHLHFHWPHLSRKHLNICTGAVLTVVGVELAHSSIMLVEISGWVLHSWGVSPILRHLAEIESVNKLFSSFDIDI